MVNWTSIKGQNKGAAKGCDRASIYETKAKPSSLGNGRAEISILLPRWRLGVPIIPCRLGPFLAPRMANRQTVNSVDS